jgi:polysaccharide biosynthesis/export protein
MRRVSTDSPFAADQLRQASDTLDHIQRTVRCVGNIESAASVQTRMRGISLFKWIPLSMRYIHSWFESALTTVGLCLILMMSGPMACAQVPPAGADAQQAAPAATKVSDNYIIGPGDTLQVFVWRNPELTSTVPVRPDGKISTPLVEDMVAVGKTPSQLARDIEKVLGEYVRSPQINVIVTQPTSAFSQIKVIGEVARPQSIAYRDGLTVLDAVLAVGGLGPFAAGNRSKIVRNTKGKSTEIKVKLADLVNDGDMRQNIALQPGDVIVIPQSRF